jgi:hypothetical protein
MIYLGNQAVGAAVGVGEFSKYASTTASTSNANYLQVDNPLSFPPKFVVITAIGDVSTGKLVGGMFLTKLFRGAYRFTGQTTTGIMYPQGTVSDASKDRYCHIDESTIFVYRLSSSNNWDTTATYLVEVYA